MRRAFGEAAMSVGALTLLVGGLVLFDDRVRDRIALKIASSPSMEFAAAGRQARDLTSVIYEAARDQSIEHAPLVIFVVAAVVLLIFMLRT